MVDIWPEKIQFLHRKTKFLKEIWFFFSPSSTEKADNWPWAVSFPMGGKIFMQPTNPCSHSWGAWSRCGSPTWQHPLNIYAAGPFENGTAEILPGGFLPCVWDCLDIHNIFGNLVSFPWKEADITAALLIRTCNVFHSRLDGGQSRGFPIRWRHHMTQRGDVCVIPPQRWRIKGALSSVCLKKLTNEERQHNFIANPAQWWLNIQVKRLLCVVVLALFATPLGLLFY